MTETAIALVNRSYCNTVLAGVYGGAHAATPRSLNTAVRLIGRKRKFSSISSTTHDVLYWLPIQQNCTLVFNCLHSVVPVYLSTACRPVSENIGRRCLCSAAHGDLVSAWNCARL